MEEEGQLMSTVDSGPLFGGIDRLATVLAKAKGSHPGAQSGMLDEMLAHLTRIVQDWRQWRVYGDPADEVESMAAMRHNLADLTIMLLEHVRVMGGDPYTEMMNALDHTLVAINRAN
jgi:hypothetical protein